MAYEYRVKSSMVCADLERRIKQLEENFSIDTGINSKFIVRDNKSGAETNNIKTYTSIEPLDSSEITGITQKESKKIGSITSAFPTYATVLIDDDGYLIQYKASRSEITKE